MAGNKALTYLTNPAVSIATSTNTVNPNKVRAATSFMGRTIADGNDGAIAVKTPLIMANPAENMPVIIDAHQGH
jgi:hypothetical protein